MLADSLTAIAHVVGKAEEAMSACAAPAGINMKRRNDLLEAREALLLAALREIRVACLRSHIDFSEMMAKIEDN
jgi:hypothetical protein